MIIVWVIYLSFVVGFFANGMLLVAGGTYKNALAGCVCAIMMFIVWYGFGLNRWGKYKPKNAIG